MAQHFDMQMSKAYSLNDAANESSCSVLGGLVLFLVVLCLPALTALIVSCSSQSYMVFTCLALSNARQVIKDRVSRNDTAVFQTFSVLVVTVPNQTGLVVTQSIFPSGSSKCGFRSEKSELGCSCLFHHFL